MADAWSLIGERLVPSVQWRMPDASVALTFDDGPHPAATPGVLDVLEKFGIQGTFFFTGMRAAQHSALLRDTAARGHAVGSHGQTHTRLFLRPRAVIVRELEESVRTISDITGMPCTLFRPPFGHFDPRLPALARQRGLDVILWTVDSRDYRATSAGEIVRRVLKQTVPGDIILFHDQEHTAAILPKALDEFIRWGLDSGLSFSKV